MTRMYAMMLMREAKSWFTGYNSNVEGHEEGVIRYLVYNGGMPKYKKIIDEIADGGYGGVKFSRDRVAEPESPLARSPAGSVPVFR